MSKTIIAPIVAMFVMVIQSAFHIKVGTDFQNAVVDFILAGVSLYGIWKNHHKPKIKE